ncbi:MAG: carbohydrate-binding protein [Bacteroidota bacterium]
MFIIGLLAGQLSIMSQIEKPDFFGISPTFSTQFDAEELEYYKEMGLNTIRIHLQRIYDYSSYDEIIATCNELSIDVMMLVTYESYPSTSELIPKWGTQIPHYTNSMELVDRLATAVPYFRDRGVKAWEIWNEENGTWHLYPDEYALLLDSVYAKFKYSDQWDPEATIVFGGIDAVGAFHPTGTNPDASQWVKDVFASAHFTNFHNEHGCYPYDVMAIHPYYTYTPEKFNYNIQDVVLNTMDSYGDTDKPLWLTELGTKKADPDENADILEEYVRMAFAHPRIERFFQFKYTYFGTPELVDDHNYFSLVERETDQSPRVYKPSWFRYRALSQELHTGPDLKAVKIGTEPRDPFPGDLVQIYAVIKNIGDSATGGQANIYFEVDGDPAQHWNMTIEELAPGDSIVALLEEKYETPALPFRVKIVADSDDQVEEKNEANNISNTLIFSSNVSLSYLGGNSDSLDFIIEMENYDIAGEGISYSDKETSNEGGAYRPDEGVDIEPTEGGYNVGWINPGEWINYSDIRGADTTYQVYARVAAINTDNRTFHLEVDGENVTGPLSFQGTNGWQSFVTVSVGQLTLPTGKNTITFVPESELFNIDHLRFVASDYDCLYCESEGNRDTTNRIFIDQVTMGDMVNTSHNDEGYGDFKTLTVEMTKDSVVDYAFIQGVLPDSSGMDSKWSVWIDLNQNQGFEKSELVVNGKTGMDISGSFTVPGSALTGSTIMRVSMKGGNSSLQPCEMIGYGEVEDYSVEIVEGVPDGITKNETSGPELLKISPTLVDEILKVDLSSPMTGELSIINMQGAIVHQETVWEVHHELNVSNLGKGVYVVMFQGKEGLETAKFIKL